MIILCLIISNIYSLLLQTETGVDLESIFDDVLFVIPFIEIKNQ
jgi:hypothetical protein